MSETPVQVIVAAYPTPDGAAKKMSELQEARQAGLIGIIDMAVIVKDESGKLKITNSKRRGTRGLITGGVVGGLIGVLAGPVGWAALGGGALGALAGRIRGLPLKNELKDLGESLTPDSSAIVAVVEHTWLAQLERDLAAEGARVVHDTIKADIAAQLESGGSVLYTAGGTSAGVAAFRVAESPSGTTVGGIVASGDVVTGFSASDEGVDVENATLTTEAPAEMAAGTPAEAPAGTAPPQAVVTETGAAGTPGTATPPAAKETEK